MKLQKYEEVNLKIREAFAQTGQKKFPAAAFLAQQPDSKQSKIDHATITSTLFLFRL